jgi:hypothetical protein
VTDSAAIGEHAGEVETRYAASSLDGARPLSQQAQRRQERETQAKPGLLSLSRSLSASVSAIPFLLPSSLRTLFFNPRVCCRFQAIRLLASPAESSLRGALILIFISPGLSFFLAVRIQPSIHGKISPQHHSFALRSQSQRRTDLVWKHHRTCRSAIPPVEQGKVKSSHCC